MHHAAGPYKSNILWKFSLQAGLVSPLFFFPFLLLCCLSTFISVSGFLFSMCRLVRPTIISACFNPNASTAHFLSCSLLILVIYLSFFSLFCFCALFSSIIALGSYCIFFVSRAGYLRLQASLFFHFYSVLRDCSFLPADYGGSSSPFYPF